jgi:ABC-type transport system involved in multi-copper enzyme maturation permease subunit
MRQFVTIAGNAFMELIRQPIFLLLMSASALFIVFLSSISYFGFGDEPKLVKDSVLAVMLLTGLLASVLSASNSVAREIRTGTALAVLAKPVGRAQFLLAKYAGVAASLAVLAYVDLIACLLASRMAFDAYGDTDWLGLGVFFGCFLVAYLMGAFSNFFLRRPFVSDAVLSIAITVTIGFVVINFLSKEGKPQSFGAGLDPRMLPAGILILFAFWVLAGLAVACSTRLEVIATLAVCSGFFLLGLMSDYLFGRAAEAGSWWANICYSVLPNWQLFWMADALEEGKHIPARYVGTACGYMLAYVGAALALALCLFEDRELS